MSRSKEFPDWVPKPGQVIEVDREVQVYQARVTTRSVKGNMFTFEIMPCVIHKDLDHFYATAANAWRAKLTAMPWDEDVEIRSHE
ncbi:hypothetical protein HN670_01235 [bacterium]|jgi:hypothetical protein|nr:hypothetical protein [bacterium]